MFDVKKHLIKVQGGRQYLPVAARLIWFRTEHPDWGIETKAIAIDVEKQYAIFESTVFDADGKLMAKGTKMENIRGFGDWLEKAETGAIGRALAVCGYGTQFAPDLDESHNNGAVDSPYPLNNYREDRSRYGQRQSRNERQSSGYYEQASGGSNGSATPNGDGLALVGNDSEDGNNLTSDSAAAQSNKNDSCEVCSTTLKPSQLSLSLRKFGSALCPECQKKRKSVEAA